VAVPASGIDSKQELLKAAAEYGAIEAVPILETSS
jgi:hypothetical protein